VTYLLALAGVFSVYSWTVCRITDPLQDGCFSRICSSYNEDSESDFWNRAGLFGIHWFGMRQSQESIGIDLNDNANDAPP